MSLPWTRGCGCGCGGGAVAELDDQAWDEHLDGVLQTMRTLYTQRLAPLEERYSYHEFAPSHFAETVKQRKPLVLLLGPYSSGKSTLINYLVQRRELLETGPQPVTDTFTLLMYDDGDERVVPGRVLVSDAQQPFRELTSFGDAFVDSLRCQLFCHPLLRDVTLVDSPGILETSAELRTRRYDYVAVCRWFVEHSDLVLFLFDPTKLDAGTELFTLFEQALRGHERKLRIILNKADTLKPQELLRVYGSLYWNMATLIRTTEPPRVYVTSMWERAYRAGTDHALFEREKRDLLRELVVTVPMQSLDRRVMALLRRTRDVLAFVLICSAYQTRMPLLCGKEAARGRFFAEYDAVVRDVAAHYELLPSYFPRYMEMVVFMPRAHTRRFRTLAQLERNGTIAKLQRMLTHQVPQLMEPIKQHALSNPHSHNRVTRLEQRYATPTPQTSSQVVAASAAAAQQQQTTRPQTSSVATKTTMAAATTMDDASTASTSAPHVP